MNALYLAILALFISSVMSASVRKWDCALTADGKIDCVTIFYDIVWNKQMVIKNLTSCTLDGRFNNPHAANCQLGADNYRIICPSPVFANVTAGCKLMKKVSQVSEVRTYDPTNKCAKATAANPEACSCVPHPRIPGDPMSKDLMYQCTSQSRLDMTEANCFTLLPLDPNSLACSVYRLHELEV